MRVFVAAVALVGSFAFAGPAVDAHVSPEDVRQICAVVARVTPEPIRDIEGAISDKPVPGAIAHDAISESTNGTKHIKTYERTDLVYVSVGKSTDVDGNVYYVQKFGKTWKVVGKGDWIR